MARQCLESFLPGRQLYQVDRPLAEEPKPTSVLQYVLGANTEAALLEAGSIQNDMVTLAKPHVDRTEQIRENPNVQWYISL
jgi:hypothetical protein